MIRQAERENCLSGGGKMGALMRQKDWSKTRLGPVEDWPQSLQTAVSIMLASGYPMYIAWGPDFIQFYNDAYRPILGSTKHPAALGQGTRECFAEIWHIIGSMFMNVMTKGEATWREDQLLPLDRNGYTEECYFTFSYSAIRDESGGVGGVFVTVIETTQRVLGERRLRMLRELGGQTFMATSAEEACRAAVSILETNRADIPFASLYLFNRDDDAARLVGGFGLPESSVLAQPEMSREQSNDALNEIWKVCAGQTVVINDTEQLFGRLPGGMWPEPCNMLTVLPVAGSSIGRLAGFLICGISARRALDDDYSGFLELAAGHIASSIANARALEEERKRAEKLSELDRAKTIFFSNVSHEFRTPLTLMLGPLEEILASPQLSQDLRAAVNVAYRNGLRLLKLVNMLLDFSRIEAGRTRTFFEPIDVNRYTEELASNFRSAIEKGGLEYVFDFQQVDEPLFIDREMWEKIVLNLISNAFKHTFAGRIVVRTFRDGTDFVLQIEDTGTGIPPEELPRIFERFHRIQNASARTHEGSGIGLSLVDELVKMHGGAISAQSEPNKGSCFTVRIPFGTAHLPADRLGANRAIPRGYSAQVNAFVQEAEQWLPQFQPPAELSLRVNASAEADVSPACILVVDDNADMRKYIAGLLGQIWTVKTAQNGAEAVRLLEEQIPDLILADVMMPEMDGFRLLRLVRNDARTNTIPFLVLSARAGDEAKVEGLEAGADDYLIKPFTARELVARVRANLQIAHIKRQAVEELSRSERALKKALGEKQVLLREVHHRVKNNFQIVSSFLSLQLRSLQDPEMKELLRKCLNRIRSMSLVHEKLYSHDNFSVIDMRSYVSSVVDYLFHSYGLAGKVRPNLEIDTKQISLDQAIPIGLIVNELITNSIKHAFAPGGSGEVRVKFSEKDDNLHLEVADNGVGLPGGLNVSDPASLGLRLVKILASQLGANLSCQSSTGGTTFQLSWKSHAATAD